MTRKGAVNQSFIEQHVLGFDHFQRLAAQVSPEYASSVAEVPASQIHQLASWIASSSPVTINCGYGMQRYSNGGQSIRAILALLCITGNIGKPGAGWVFANLQSHVFGDRRDPVASYPDKQEAPFRRSISIARLGPEMLAAHDPPLKMIWVERGNPLSQNPETATVARACRALHFRVVVEQSMTDTARQADLILPAKTLFEQTDVINAYWHDYIQIKTKILEPPEHVKPESIIYHELAQRLGISDQIWCGCSMTAAHYNCRP